MASVKNILEILRNENQNDILKRGFKNPHSYRGYYDELGVEMTYDCKIEHMVRDLEKAIDGRSFTAWKGGEYTYDENTNVYLADEGFCGLELSIRLLQDMLNNRIEKIEIIKDGIYTNI